MSDTGGYNPWQDSSRDPAAKASPMKSDSHVADSEEDGLGVGGRKKTDNPAHRTCRSAPAASRRRESSARGGNGTGGKLKVQVTNEKNHQTRGGCWSDGARHRGIEDRGKVSSSGTSRSGEHKMEQRRGKEPALEARPSVRDRATSSKQRDEKERRPRCLHAFGSLE